MYNQTGDRQIVMGIKDGINIAMGHKWQSYACRWAQKYIKSNDKEQKKQWDKRGNDEMEDDIKKEIKTKSKGD